jgi:hypothetical protein
MHVQEVHFNHDTTSASHDALTMCRNGLSGAILAPEWQRGFPSQPAAYAIGALVAPITIKAKFSGGPQNAARNIRAIDGAPSPPQKSGCSGIIAAILDAIQRALFGNILGEVAAQAVQFDGNGNSALTTFPLAGQWLTSNGFVSKRATVWQWQYFEKGSWHDFDLTTHTIYVVLNVPNAPWLQTGDVTQLPWADALDRACVWALGAKTLDEAAARITFAVNRQQNESYTPMTMFGFGDYNLASYLNHVTSGMPFIMNCTDCADAVTSLSDLLGCSLAEGQFFNMQTRPFLTLAGDPSNGAAWVTFNWSYHEICWLNDFVSNTVWDGCLQLDMANNPNAHIAKLPVKVPFSAGNADDYKPRLIASGQGTLNGFTRHRRVI